MSKPSHHTSYRHAEPVSASIVRGMVIGAKKHILSKILGNAVMHKNAIGMTQLGNNNHNGWRTLNPYNAILGTDICDERKYL